MADENPRWTAVKGSYEAKATVIRVNNPSLFDFPSAVARAPKTGEIFLVTGIMADGIEVQRGFASTSAAQLHDEDPLILIGWDESARASHAA